MLIKKIEIMNEAGDKITLEYSADAIFTKSDKMGSLDISMAKDFNTYKKANNRIMRIIKKAGLDPILDPPELEKAINALLQLGFNPTI